MGSNHSAVVKYKGGLITMDENPFAFGASRRSFKGTGVGGRFNNRKVCVKIPKDEKFEFLEDWKMDMDVVIIASNIVKDFNNEVKDDKKVIVNEVSMCQVESAAMFKFLWFIPFERGFLTKHLPVIAEFFLEGVYEKYNTNGGWVGRSKRMQVLSHFSWANSKGKMLLCDLQGVTYDDKIVITDPAIHSYDRSYGSTDSGLHGFVAFFTTHICNNDCKGWPRMKLDGLGQTVIQKIASNISNRATQYMFENKIKFTQEEEAKILQLYQESINNF